MVDDKSCKNIAYCIIHTCECIFGISPACCNMSLSADVFEQTFATSHLGACEFDTEILLFTSFTEAEIESGISCWFGDGIAFNDCKLDEMNPGGGSTPSSISMARCKRAFLSQSSFEYSYGNLFQRKIFFFLNIFFHTY